MARILVEFKAFSGTNTKSHFVNYIKLGPEQDQEY